MAQAARIPVHLNSMSVCLADILAGPIPLEHWRDGEVLEGSVEMHIAGLRRSFRTRNRMREYEAIEMELVDGPFSHLSGGWQFRSHGHLGSKVSLEVEFEIKSRTTNQLLGRSFEAICNSLVDAFVRRAEDIYSGAGE